MSKIKREYKAVVKRVYDAKTIVLNIDLGFGMWMHHQKVKLYGTEDLPGTRGEDRKRGSYLKNILSDAILYREVTIVSLKEGNSYEVIMDLELVEDGKIVKKSINTFIAGSYILSLDKKDKELAFMED